MTVYVLVYHGSDNTVHISNIYEHKYMAEDYIKNHGGWHSEIHFYEIEEHKVIE